MTAPINAGPDRDEYVRAVYASLERAIKHAVDFKVDSCTLPFRDACALSSLLATSEYFAWRDTARINQLDAIARERGAVWSVRIGGVEFSRDLFIRGAIDGAILAIKPNSNLPF